jgi:hypothetical protein
MLRGNKCLRRRKRRKGEIIHLKCKKYRPLKQLKKNQLKLKRRKRKPKIQKMNQFNHY